MSYFLPHLLALSCSSPFWEGRNTGLKSYRLTVFDALPRTGLPERFASYAEYERHINILMNAGLIEDATRIWWDLRPSARYPTLETRVMDVCTRLDDTISLAALMLIRENRWRAMRYSFDEGLIDLGKGGVVPFENLLDEILSLVSDDARALDCVEEVARTRNILTRGTSAHRQLKCYELELADGKEKTECLRAVVDMLISDTAEGV
jgi:carboxylate-amine ligase